MILALQALAIAAALRHDRRPMRANVIKCAQVVLLIPHNDEWLIQHFAAEIIADSHHIFQPANRLPGLEKDLLRFQSKKRGIGVPARGHRFGAGQVCCRAVIAQVGRSLHDVTSFTNVAKTEIANGELQMAENFGKVDAVSRDY